MIKKYININSISKEEYDRIYRIIPDSLRRAINRKRNIVDRQLSLAGELLARRCISDLCGIAEEAAEIAKDSLGKPLSKNTAAHISISHSGEYAAAVASFSPIGIDIEEVRPISLRLAGKICTAEEQQDIFGSRDIPCEADISADELKRLSEKLLIYWTLKEGYLKNIGTGISGGLKSGEFKFSDGRVIGPHGYSFYTEEAPCGYITSVCIKE